MFAGLLPQRNHCRSIMINNGLTGPDGQCITAAQTWFLTIIDVRPTLAVRLSPKNPVSAEVNEELAVQKAKSVGIQAKSLTLTRKDFDSGEF
jgi:hypothetical protein